MKISQAERLIPTALSEIHAEGEAAAYYPEIVRHLVAHDERYVARRTAISGLLSKVGIDMPIIPDFPLSPRPGVVYPALAMLEQKGIIEGYFQPEPQGGNPHRRRVYRLAQNPDDIAG